MKNIIELSRDELLSYIVSNFTNVNIFENNLCCALCGTQSNAKYYYICDQCNGKAAHE